MGLLNDKLIDALKDIKVNYTPAFAGEMYYASGCGCTGNCGQSCAGGCETGSIVRVLYPGLTEHPGYEIMKKQSRGFGAMLTFQTDTTEQALSVLNKVKLIQYAESLGGVETLITYPTTQTHADVPEEIRLKNGITPATLRLSVGIENVDDLIADLEQALKK